ncbi:FxSxx-COOH system tetratricopeptide repeat protein [Streptomyces sp. NPDC096080]|uniref:FxSxx-COOH system tetratricopeptide repeat protein n=1 Tax=Streptomyces sp. NPDC096080 TaxID=3156693 RepID=UPI0033207F4C
MQDTPAPGVQASNGSLAARDFRARDVYFGDSRSAPEPAAVTVAPPLGLRDPQCPLRGRDALIEQLESALSVLASPRLQVLCGMGGAGKTAIALEVVHRRLCLAQQVWWVDAGQHTTLEAGLRAVARQAGAPDEQVRAGDAADVLWSYLARYERPWLLVVDNADEPALLDGAGRLSEGTGWIRLPANNAGSVLVTTRDSTPHTWGSACILHPVSPLTGDDLADAAQILRDHAGTMAGPPDDARRLAQRLGGLPLALRLASTYLADANRVPAAYHEPGTPMDFDSYHAALDRGLELVDRGNVIAQTWAMSLELLEQRGMPLTRPLLRLIATFADAPLPYTLLLTPQTLASAGELASLDGPGVWRLLTALAGLGLVDLPPAGVSDALPTLRVHPLVRDASLDHAALGAAVTALHSAAFAHERAVPEEPDYWDHWRLLQPHALDLFHRATATESPHQTIHSAGRTATLAARYLLARGLDSQARSEFEAILTHQRTSLGDTHPSTLTTRYELARVLHHEEELDRARSEFEAILTHQRTSLGDTDPSTLTTRYELARVLHGQGELDRARSEFEAILTHQRASLGDTHLSTLATRHELARVFYDQGELDRARSEFEAVLTHARASLGDTHPSTLTTRYSMAQVLHDRGELDRARSEFEAILTHARASLGDTHPSTLTTRHELAWVLHGQGELDRARSEFEAILTHQRTSLGDTHPSTLTTRYSIAQVLHHQGELDRARSEFEAILTHQRTSLGDTDPSTLTTRYELARVLYDQGELDRARSEFEAVLTDERASLGDTHPRTLATRHEIDGLQQLRADD